MFAIIQNAAPTIAAFALSAAVFCYIRVVKARTRRGLRPWQSIKTVPDLGVWQYTPSPTIRDMEDLIERMGEYSYLYSTEPNRRADGQDIRTSCIIDEARAALLHAIADITRMTGAYEREKEQIRRKMKAQFIGESDGRRRTRS